MVRIGIISERPTKKERVFLERYKREVIKNDKNPFEMVAVRVPYSGKQIQRRPSKRVIKSISKAKKILEKLGIEKILFSELIKEHVDLSEFSVKESQKDEKFLLTVPLCIRRFSTRCGFVLPAEKICIRASKMDRITEYLLRELCFDARTIVLCVENPKGADMVCEKLFDDFGLMVQLAENFSEAYADILIDTKTPSVRIGRDLVIDGAELDFEMNGICVDSMEVAACLSGFDPSMKVKAFFSNKKKLTL